MVVSTPLFAFRLRLVRFLETQGMDAPSARTLDSAASQWAGKDCKKFAFFANQCFKHWKKLQLQQPGTKKRRRSKQKHTTVPIESVIQAAVQSLQRHADVKKVEVKDSLTAEQRAAQEKRLQEWRENRTEDTICPHCRSLEHSTSEYGNQDRAADEGSTAMRKCDNPLCHGKPWKVKKNQINSKKKAVRATTY